MTGGVAWVDPRSFYDVSRKFAIKSGPNSREEERDVRNRDTHTSGDAALVLIFRRKKFRLYQNSASEKSEGERANVVTSSRLCASRRLDSPFFSLDVVDRTYVRTTTTAP